ncbi:NAD-dependent succinate-semialdehyde dehydrogenase [Siminovitchia sediminis]|uniref:NAD-dependent succinate-semialdehyde dehydrogenase n=1 Tax=Siminovitchia sediminis TaxID=1274353 RepID=A0ABW4KN16_9BACI
MKEGLLFINGEWITSETNQWIDVENPASAEIVGRVSDAGASETRLAIAAAEEAFSLWSQLPAKERADYLMAVGKKMMDRQKELAMLLTHEQGKPLAESLGEIAISADYLFWNAEEAKRVYGETIPASSSNKRMLAIRQPLGVCAAITPWNFPAMMITRKIGPALAAGCTVVVKPASYTPLTAVAIMEIFEEVGIPKGVVNLVTGSASEISGELMSNNTVRKISFTGSTAVGKLLMRDAADQVKKLSLELGGHAPLIIFSDADLDAAVQGVMNSKFRNAGQMCVCVNRLYVERSVAEEVTSKLAKAAAALKVGNGLDSGVEVGPLINRKAIDHIQSQVDDALTKGAKVITGGCTVGMNGEQTGAFYQPTILSNVSDDAIIQSEETFGPVLPIWVFDDEQEVVQKANDSEYGLAAYLYTRDLARSVRVSEALEYGIVGINDTGVAAVQAPFGGMKQSGFGVEGGYYGVEEYTQIKYISVQI